MLSLIPSLDQVEAWAKAEFPESFAALSKSKIEGLLDRSFDGLAMDGKTFVQPMLISALQVGQTTIGEDVYARITETDDVELFSEVVHFKEMAEESLRFAQPVKDLADISLHQPFKFPIDTEHPACVDRLEALIRYYYLVGGTTCAVQNCLEFFKAHFREACRDVARGIGAVIEDDDDDDNTISGDTPPDLMADTDVTGLQDNPAATSVFNKQVHAMDETYHDFKSSLLKQFGAMQTVDRNEMAQLRAKVQELQLRLGLLEKNQTEMGKQLEAEKIKSTTATKDAENWKLEYEGLKKNLEGVLYQQS